MLESFLNGNGVLYLWQKVKNTFVAKVEGKGLSTNDYSEDEKMKLHGSETGANKTVVADSLTNDSPTDALSAKQGKVLDGKISAINTSIGNLGGGDMLKSAYDADGNGSVDNADNATKFGGQSPDYYAKTTDLSGYVQNSKIGVAGGTASLGSDGKVPASQLPETAPAEHTHPIEDLTGLQDVLDEVSDIAAGKCKSYVFDTVDALDAELAKTEFTGGLKTGDVFYIRALETPDYWWDAETGEKRILETTKVDLPVLTNAEIDEIIAAAS